MSLQLSAAQAAFLQGPLSINVAATGSDGWPLVCRAQACLVARDRCTVTVLLSARRAREVLLALGARSVFACAFTRPATHATLQLKARTHERVPVTAAFRQRAARSLEAFAAELAGLGFGPELTGGVIDAMTSDDLVAVRFTPDIVFDQTPGPDAGRVLAAA